MSTWGSKPKNTCYAVKVGRKPGIYDTWPETQAQVQGYSGAVYKGFPTREEALSWLAGEPASRGAEAIPESGLVVYTDGSFRKGRYSWAFVAVKDGQVVAEDAGVGTDDRLVSMRNVAGEIEAVYRALEWALMNGYDRLTIVHDYSGLGCWARGEWEAKNEATRAFRDRMSRHPGVAFLHVKGHQGVEYNERADCLAGAALEAILNG